MAMAEPGGLPPRVLPGRQHRAAFRFGQGDLAAQIGRQFRHPVRPQRRQCRIEAEGEQRLDLRHRAFLQHRCEPPGDRRPQFRARRVQQQHREPPRRRGRRLGLPVGQSPAGGPPDLPGAGQPLAVRGAQPGGGLRIGGGERDPETPISVVGASIIGGDTVDHGLWVAFWFFLAQLNFVLGAINLVPLLPFDGGHIAIAVFEKIRNMIRSARGKVAAAPVNYMKLMPATYVILVVVMGYMLLTVTADLVNPIRLFQ